MRRLVVALFSCALLHAQPARPRITGVAHIAVWAKDYQASRAFYRDFLGFEEPYSLQNPDGSPSLTFFKVNERQYIELFPEREPGTDRLNHISIETDNAEAMRVYLASKGVKVPEKVGKGRIGNSNFNVRDPEGHTVEIVQYEPTGWTVREKGKFVPETRISKRIMHVGIIVTKLDPEMKFYKDVLGFTETWRGSSNGTQLSWINLKVPEGDDYIELMLYKDAPEPTRRGGAHHLALEVPDIAASVAALEKRPYRAQYTRPIEIRTGINRKRQSNFYDPDGTRTELMEPVTIDGTPTPSSTAPPPDVAAVGAFDGSSDVGTVVHAGSAAFDPAGQTYTISGSGENMWAAADAFHFVWKRMSGDVTLTADIDFAGQGGDAHRKGVLMIRQSLDGDSAYADAALHGDGLTSLQARDAKGARTHEVQSNVVTPKRLRIEKRGDYFYMSVAGAGEDPRFAGGSMRIALTEPFYVGLGVCAHRKEGIETVAFSKVSLTQSAAEPAGATVRYSTLETVTVASTDRRVVHVTADRLASPTWSSDGASLLFNANGKLHRIPVTGGTPEAVDAPRADIPSTDGKYIYFHSDRTGTTQIWRKLTDGTAEEQVTSGEFNAWYPHPSPDGRRLVFLCYEPATGPQTQDRNVILRILTLADMRVTVLAKLIGGPGTIDLPSWSPDSRRLAFVSYQHRTK